MESVSRPWGAFWLALALGVALGCVGAKQPYSVIYNGTPSIKVGFYLLKSGEVPTLGQLAAFRPPTDRDSYHPTTQALLARHSLKLIKPVGALPGEAIVSDGYSVWRCTDATALPGEGCEKLGDGVGQDSKGRELPLWTQGSYTLGAAEWYMGSSAANPKSFDSRYFGPVPESHIEGVARPLLTWE